MHLCYTTFMKKILFLIVILFLGISGFWYFNKSEPATVESNLKNYRNNEFGISFSYPDNLLISTNEDGVALYHDIPYENTGACDMVGEEIVYERLTDLHIGFRTFDSGLVETMKTVSPYIPEENFVNNQVIESPGFIDAYSIGKWNGFAIYEGAEGCGQTAYYFPINKDRTLLVTKASIQALSGVRSPEAEASILAVPGVISREEYMKIFEEIMKTLEAK